MDAVTSLFPGAPSVACFDTAFHATMPAGASTYALPARWRERWGGVTASTGSRTLGCRGGSRS
jgi:acetate kinase